MEEIDDLGRLAVYQALMKRVGEQTKTHVEGNFRATVDDQLVTDYYDDGTDRRRIKLNGSEVGTLTVKTKKDGTETKLVVEDRAAFAAWLDTDEGTEALHEFERAHQAEFIAQMAREGELPDGCSYVESRVPGGVSGTVLKVDPDKVVSALGAALPDTIAGLLVEGGDE